MVERIQPITTPGTAIAEPVGEQPEPVVATGIPPSTEKERREKRRLISAKRLYKKSRVERELDKQLRACTPDSRLCKVISAMVDDPLIASVQNYANVVAIQRLGYNDHGPVHARIVAINALRVLDLLEQGGVHPSIVVEEVGTGEDARIAVFMAAFLHDLGMSVTRDNHEWHGVHIADRFLDHHLGRVFEDQGRIYMMKSLINEAIIGHMGHYRVNSVEAGVVMIGDGADCTKGRAQIPTQLAKNPMIGDIHRFSASAIESVRISRGLRKPVRIDVHMNSSAGLFQVEEVLIGKAKISPIMNFLEIAAYLEGKERLYLQ
jgi:metal-dependent HD superfamily phosphatase/phosphodiesterase